MKIYIAYMHIHLNKDSFIPIHGVLYYSIYYTNLDPGLGLFSASRLMILDIGMICLEPRSRSFCDPIDILVLTADTDVAADDPDALR